jgi:hypothetical protein
LAFSCHPSGTGCAERSGWLFQQLGEQGIVVGTLLMSIVFILIGLVGMLRWARRLRTVREARISAAMSRAASQRIPVETKGRGQAGVGSAFVGLLFLVASGGIAYFGLYLPFLTGRPDMKATFLTPPVIGYGLAYLLLGQRFGPTMYRRKDGIYIPTVVGAATLIVLLCLGLGLDWWIMRLQARPY